MDIDLELDGVSATQAALARLRERWSGPVEIIVFSRADYSESLEFGRGPVTPDTAEALRFEVDGDIVYAARASGHPPYPFFRPAIREFEASPERFIQRHDPRGRSLDDFRSVDALMRGLGSALETRIKQNATAQRGGGRSPGTVPGHPKVKTGNLRQGIGFVMLRT